MIGMLNRNAEPQLRPKIKICEFCMKDFTTSELAATKLRNHVAYTHMSSRYVCVLCSSESGQKPSVYDHIEDTHIQPNINKKRNRNISNESIPIIDAVFVRFVKAPIMTYSIT